MTTKVSEGGGKTESSRNWSNVLADHAVSIGGGVVGCRRSLSVAGRVKRSVSLVTGHQAGIRPTNRESMARASSD